MFESAMWARGMACLVERLPNIHGALGLIPSTSAITVPFSLSLWLQLEGQTSLSIWLCRSAYILLNFLPHFTYKHTDHTLVYLGDFWASRVIGLFISSLKKTRKSLSLGMFNLPDSQDPV